MDVTGPDDVRKSIRDPSFQKWSTDMCEEYSLKCTILNHTKLGITTLVKDKNDEQLIQIVPSELAILLVVNHSHLIILRSKFLTQNHPVNHVMRIQYSKQSDEKSKAIKNKYGLDVTEDRFKYIGKYNTNITNSTQVTHCYKVELQISSDNLQQFMDNENFFVISVMDKDFINTVCMIGDPALIWCLIS